MNHTNQMVVMPLIPDTTRFTKTTALLCAFLLVFCVVISGMVCLSPYPLLTVGTWMNQQCGIEKCRVGINFEELKRLSSSEQFKSAAPVQDEHDPSSSEYSGTLFGALAIIGIQSANIRGNHRQHALQVFSWASFGVYTIALGLLGLYGLFLFDLKWWFWLTLASIAIALVLNSCSCISFLFLKDKIIAKDVTFDELPDPQPAGAPGSTTEEIMSLLETTDESQKKWEPMFFLYCFAILAAFIVCGANGFAFWRKHS